MNSLSWFIYLADVLNSVGIVIGITSFFLLAGLAMYSVVCSISDEKFTLPPFRWMALGLLLALISAALPTKSTMYAIAASEFGEKLAKSDAAKEITGDATKALQSWIKKQIEPEKAK